MPKSNPSNMPQDLEAAGEALWTSVAGRYELRPDEREILHGACRAADMIASLRAAWDEAGRPMLTKGSMGQEVIHPIVGELRTQEAQKASLLARLKLPDDAGADVVQMNQHRSAANAKWSVPGAGRGA